LASILPADRILTAPEDLIPYSFDGTAALSQRPLAVVLATTTDEVSRILRWANETRTPIIARGSGTGLAGGSVPTAGSVVLCLSRFDKVLELDRRNLTLLVEPGVTTQTIFDLADGRASLSARSRLDENLDHRRQCLSNSGGLRGLKYGVTKDYVMGFEIVLPSGEVVWIGNKCVKDVAGYSLREVFIGSEGTLGVFTKILLACCPSPPRRKRCWPFTRGWRTRRKPFRRSSRTRSFRARSSFSTGRRSTASRITRRSACRARPRPFCSWKPTAIRRSWPRKRRSWRGWRAKHGRA
jgi:glycolate oxidase